MRHQCSSQCAQCAPGPAPLPLPQCLAAEVGIERPSLRLDSQAKYGEREGDLGRGRGCKPCRRGRAVQAGCLLLGVHAVVLPLRFVLHSRLLSHPAALFFCFPYQLPADPLPLPPQPICLFLSAAGALSRGDASVFMRFPDPSYREKIWDHCAGVIILEVGGHGGKWAGMSMATHGATQGAGLHGAEEGRCRLCPTAHLPADVARRPFAKPCCGPGPALAALALVHNPPFCCLPAAGPPCLCSLAPLPCCSSAWWVGCRRRAL